MLMPARTAPRWDENIAKGIVVRAVSRKLHLFNAFPDIGKDDLIQEGMITAARFHEVYDPLKSAYTTWIYRCVSCRLLDLRTVRTRTAKRDTVIAVEKPSVHVDPHLMGEAGGDESADLLAWTANAYRQIRRNATVYLAAAGAVRGRGHPTLYTPAQKMAMLALKAHRRLSVRGLEHLLESRGDIRSAMELDRTPSIRTLAYLQKSVTQIIPGFAPLKGSRPNG